MDYKMHIANLSFLLLLATGCWGQDVVHNFGTIQIHDTGMVGFHGDVINDGTFDENLGLVGFYAENGSLTLSGTSNPIFYDMEVETANDLLLETRTGVRNNLNFIQGDIVSPRAIPEININFIESAFYTGDGNLTKVDGYAAITGKSEFLFPIGEEDRLRPLEINSNAINDEAKCAYFSEDPNATSVLGASFDTDSKANPLLTISTSEFWQLDGSVSSTVTLTWDDESNVELFAESILDLTVVGWNSQEDQWVDLGNTAVEGTLESGMVTSDTFLPNDFEIITLGSISFPLDPNTILDLGNFFLSPNGDGINDFLVIDGLENLPDNTLRIYNRYGVLIYSMADYDNSFNGISNVTNTIKRNKGLPSGVYFYILELNGEDRKHQGYMYITPRQSN